MSLNSKKSWDPNRKSNRTKLESLESDALNQEKLRRATLEAEREHEQLQQLANDAKGGSEVSRNRSWMYTSKSDNVLNLSEESSEILLGNRSRSRYSEAEKAEQRMLRQQNRKLTADPLEMLDDEIKPYNAKPYNAKPYEKKYDDSRINKANRSRNGNYTDSREESRARPRSQQRSQQRPQTRPQQRSQQSQPQSQPQSQQSRTDARDHTRNGK